MIRTSILPETVPARLFERLERAPEQRALAFYQSDGTTTWRTYSEVHAAAAGSAGRMAELGVGRGDAVVIVLSSAEPAATLVLGSLLLGARPLLVAPPSLLGANSDLPRVLSATVRRTEARLVVAPGSMARDRDQLERVRRSTRWLFSEEEALGPPDVDAVPRHLPDPSDVVAYQLTSGTTGLPKVCVWEHHALTAAIDGMVAAMELTDRDVFFNWTPLYHDMGLVNNFLTCMATGIPLVLMSPHDFVKSPAAWLQGVHRTGATVTWSPNFGYALAAQRVKDSDLEGVDLDGVRGWWNAAERIHHETFVEFHRRFESFGVPWDRLRTNFGCAENIGGATFTRPGEPYRVEFVDREALAESRTARIVDPADEKAVSIVGSGRPHPGIKIQILSPRGESLPEGHVGEIALDTASRMNGYLRNAEATKRAIHGDLLRTGDLGYLRDDELYWAGRVRERITVRGKKFDPSDFEPFLLEVQGLRKGCFAAFGMDETGQGTQRVVVVSEVTDPMPRPADEIAGEIRRQSFLRLGINVDVVLVPTGTLTKTSSGKRRHRHFKRMYESGELQQVQVS